MKKALPAIISAIILFTGCRLDPVAFNEGAAPAVSSTYFPSEKNTTWIYQSFFLGQLAGQNTVKLTGNTTVTGGRLFYEADSFDGTEHELAYYSRENGIYSFKGSGLGADFENEVEYLRENASVGESWSKDFPADAQGVKQQVICTVKEKGIKKTVLGKEYSSVIHTFIESKSDMGPGYTTQATMHFYIAKGVGIIQIDSEVLGLEISFRLKSYDIK